MIKDGFRFKDPTVAGGISHIRLLSPAGQTSTKISVRAKGPLLSLASDFTTLGLEPEGQVLIEIRRTDNGECWGAGFFVQYGLFVSEPVIRGANGG